jgi:hypothetical protein
MNLNAAIIEFESEVGNVRTGIWSAVSQTWEEYVTITSGGRKTEAAAIAVFASQDEAVDRWLEAVRVYAKGKNGTLYWRALPTLEKDERGWFSVYSRLLISDRPVTARLEGKELVRCYPKAA